MRVLVTGGRKYNDKKHVETILDHYDQEKPISCLIQGGASGADKLASNWARKNCVATMTYFAEWNIHGKAAGPIRNRAMLEAKPDFVVAFPGGTGTADCVKQALEMGIPVYIQEKLDDSGS
jgi:hypothetical protein